MIFFVENVISKIYIKVWTSISSELLINVYNIKLIPTH